MEVQLSFLVLKAVAAFQDPQHVARSQAVCKNWCWGMREQVASITTDSISACQAGVLTQALLSGLCSPDTLILDVVGRQHGDVASKEQDALAAFLCALKQQTWFRKLALVQDRVNARSAAARYTRSAGYSTSWHLERTAPLVEAGLQAVPEQLQVLDLQLECLPSPTALASLARCSRLHSLRLNCQQGTLTPTEAEHLLGLAASLQTLDLALPEMQLPAVNSLVTAFTDLTRLRLYRKSPSVCATVLPGLLELTGLQELRLAGYGVASAGLRMLTGLTALELSHAAMATQDDWEAVAALTALQELHLVPAAEAMLVQQQVSCAVPFQLPHLTSFKMRINADPTALHMLSGTPLLHTLHLAIPHTNPDLPSHVLYPLSCLLSLRSLTLDGPGVCLDDGMLSVLCDAARHVTQLLILGRLGPLGPAGLAPLAELLTGLKHLALGGRHMDQMFVVDPSRDLPKGLEVLELCSACLVQPRLLPSQEFQKGQGWAGGACNCCLDKDVLAGTGIKHAKSGRTYARGLGASGLAGSHVDGSITRNGGRTGGKDRFVAGREMKPLEAHGGEGAHSCVVKAKTSKWDRNRAAASGTPTAIPVSCMAAYPSTDPQGVQPAMSTTASAVHWPHLRVLCLHKCCGVPPGTTMPDSTMLLPVLFDTSNAPVLASVSLVDCTLGESSLQTILAGGNVSSLSLAPYENWRGTAARLTPAGMQSVLWSRPATSLQQLELRLTHRMHRDGMDVALLGKVLPGLSHLRGLRLYTEESHWHRLPAVKAFGKLTRLQQLHIGAVHERRATEFVDSLRQVLPEHCRMTVVKYVPDLMEDQ